MDDRTKGAKTLFAIKKLEAVSNKLCGLIITARVNAGDAGPARQRALETRLERVYIALAKLEAQNIKSTELRGVAFARCRRKLLNFREVCTDFVQSGHSLSADTLWPILRSGCVRVYLLDANETRRETVSVVQGIEKVSFDLNSHGHDYTRRELFGLPDCLLFHPTDVACALRKAGVPLTDAALTLVGRIQAKDLLEVVRAVYQAEESIATEWKASKTTRPTVEDLEILCAGGFTYDRIACNLMGWEYSDYRATQNQGGDLQKGQPVKTFADALRRRHDRPPRPYNKRDNPDTEPPRK